MVIVYSVAQYLLFIVVVTILVKPLGGYVERVFTGKRTALDRSLLPLEKLIYRITRVIPPLK
jgi:K+-transporting ATPase ATPase A chain